jgi:hypothetical protein
MEEDVAKMVVAAGFLVGLLFWFLAVVMYRKIAGSQPPEPIEAKIPGKSPSEAIRDLIAQGQLFSNQASVSRPADNRLSVAHSGMRLDLEAIQRGGDALMVAKIDDSVFNRRFAIGLGAFVLLLMPAVIAGVPYVLWNYVATSDSPGVRWQAVQVLQIVHVLWPPFMIYFMWKGIRRNVINSISNMLLRAEAGAWPAG